MLPTVKINQQRARCEFFDVQGDAQHHRDGAQGFRHPAHDGGLLTDQGVPPGRYLLQPQLGDYIRRTLNGFFLVGAENDLKGSIPAVTICWAKPPTTAIFSESMYISQSSSRGNFSSRSKNHSEVPRYGWSRPRSRAL